MATLFSPDGRPGDIPDDQVEKALTAGFHRAVPMLAPTGHRGLVPEHRADEARRAGFVPDLKAPIPTELQGPPKGILEQALQNLPAGLADLPRRLTASTPGMPAENETLGRDEQGHVVYRPAQGMIDTVQSLLNLGKNSSDIPSRIAQSFADDPVGLPLTAAQILSGAIGRKPPADSIRPATEEEFLKKSQPAVATYAPKNKLKLQQDLRTAIPAMQEINPNVKVDLLSNDETASKVIGPKPKVKDTFLPTNQAAIKKIDDALEPMYTRADTYGITGNGTNIVNRILDSVPEKYQTFNPTGYQNLKDSLAPYLKPGGMSPRQLNNFKATTNAQLSKFYEGLAPQVNDTLASNAHMASLEEEANALRDEIYSKIDPEHNGELAADLNNRRGALQNVRDNQIALINKTVGTPQPNLGQKIVGTVAGAVRGPKAMAMEALARPATAADNIEKAFQMKMAPLGAVPAIPPTYPRNPLQLGPGTPQIEAPGYNKSDLTSPAPTNVTTGAPLQIVEPAAPLTPTEPGMFDRQRSFAENPVGEGLAHDLKSNPKYTWYEPAEQRPIPQMQRPPAETFDWQRLLFPDQPERPVEPPPK